MVNYQEGKIYKIYSTIDDSICYVGSTTKTLLCQRMIQHRKDYKTWKKGNHDKVTSYDIFDKFGLENCIIELLLLYPCNSKDELNKKEGEFIRNLNCVNKIIAGRTSAEYYRDNKEKLKIRKKIYRDNNKEIISEKKKEKMNCECGSFFRKSDKAAHYRTLKHINYIQNLNNSD